MLIRVRLVNFLLRRGVMVLRPLLGVVERCECGGRFKLGALVMVLQALLGVVEAHNIERILRYLGEPVEPPRRAPARDPPYFKSKVQRAELGSCGALRLTHVFGRAG